MSKEKKIILKKQSIQYSRPKESVNKFFQIKVSENSAMNNFTLGPQNASEVSKNSRDISQASAPMVIRTQIRKLNSNNNINKIKRSKDKPAIAKQLATIFN